MRKNDIFDAFESLDPKFVDEAAPNINKKAKRPLAFRLIAIAACIALLVTGVVVGTLLLNREGDPQDATDEIPERIKQYQDSEYFEVIRKFDEYYEYRANTPPVNIYGGEESHNVKVTDNQTKGVEEQDKIKRTETHIFYMDETWIRAFSIDGENSVEVGSCQVSSQTNNEILLSEDGKTVTVISHMNVMESDHGVSYTDLHSFDVSDPENITKKATVRIKGSCVSARLVDKKLLLFIRYRPYDPHVNFSKPETFLPGIDRGNGFELLPDCEIICNERMTNSTYTVALMFDEKDLTLEKNIAVLSYSGDPYVSEDKIFFNGDGSLAANAMPRTNILAVGYSGEKFEMLGSVSIRGDLKDQWSMDEYKGILRVVTTTETSANLYCISLESFEELASVKGFAPENEDVQSVRFEGDYAYVCTAKKNQGIVLDPVFFFDLSDLDNIIYKDTGTIEGMSTSLIDYGNGYLIGIGSKGLVDWSAATLKIEAYKEAEDHVVSVCAYELDNTWFPEDYKAYYIDRRNQILGFGYSRRNPEVERSIIYAYTLLRFDAQNEEFVELITVDLYGDQDNKRGVYIDGYMYMFGTDDFKVVAVDLEKSAADQPSVDQETGE